MKIRQRLATVLTVALIASTTTTVPVYANTSTSSSPSATSTALDEDDIYDEAIIGESIHGPDNILYANVIEKDANTPWIPLYGSKYTYRCINAWDEVFDIDVGIHTAGYMSVGLSCETNNTEVIYNATSSSYSVSVQGIYKVNDNQYYVFTSVQTGSSSYAIQVLSYNKSTHKLTLAKTLATGADCYDVIAKDGYVYVLWTNKSDSTYHVSRLDNSLNILKDVIVPKSNLIATDGVNLYVSRTGYNDLTVKLDMDAGTYENTEYQQLTNFQLDGNRVITVGGVGTKYNSIEYFDICLYDENGNLTASTQVNEADNYYLYKAASYLSGGNRSGKYGCICGNKDTDEIALAWGLNIIYLDNNLDTVGRMTTVYSDNYLYKSDEGIGIACRKTNTSTCYLIARTKSSEFDFTDTKGNKFNFNNGVLTCKELTSGIVKQNFPVDSNMKKVVKIVYDSELTSFQAEVSNVYDWINNLKVIDIDCSNLTLKSTCSYFPVEAVNINGDNLILEDTFKVCPDLKTVNLNGSNITIGDGAFSNSGIMNDTLDSILDYIKASSDTISPRAFSYCENVTSVDLNGITEIGTNAFANCKNLASIDFDGITKINDYAFAYCTSLPIAVLTDVETLGMSAFIGCTGLEKVYLGEDLLELPSKAFYACSSLNEIYNNAQFIQNVASDALPTHAGNKSAYGYDVNSKFKTAAETASYVWKGEPPVLDLEKPVITKHVATPDEFGDTVIKLKAEDNVTDASSLTYRMGETGVWKSSNTFSVSQAGTYVFYAKDAAGNISDPYEVVVTSGNTLVTEVAITPTTLNGNIGDTYQIPYTITPTDATDATLTWASNNPTVATVDNTGKVSYLAEGDTIITATSNDGSNKSDTVDVHVSAVLVDSVDITTASMTGVVGDTLTIPYVVGPTNATNKSVDWSVSDTTKATVEAPGKIKLLAPGEVQVTATSSDGSNISDTVTITISENVVAPTSIDITESVINCSVGDTLPIEYTISPTDATNKVVDWTVDDTNKATQVSNNIFKFTEAGTVIITGTVHGTTLSDSVVVNITPVTKTVASIALADETAFTKNYTVGDIHDLQGKILITYSDGSTEEKALTYDMVETFDTSSEGNKVVTLTYEGKKVSYSITVTKNLQPVSISLDVDDSNPKYKKVKVHVDGNFKSIELPGGQTIYYNDFTYTIRDNGTYVFSTISKDGESTDSEVLNIDDIDKTAPIIAFSQTTASAINIRIIDDNYDRTELPDGTSTVLDFIEYVLERGLGTFVAYDEAGNVTTKDFLLQKEVQIGENSHSTTFVNVAGIPTEWTNQDATVEVFAVNPIDGIDEVRLEDN